MFRRWFAASSAAEAVRNHIHAKRARLGAPAFAFVMVRTTQSKVEPARSTQKFAQRRAIVFLRCRFARVPLTALCHRGILRVDVLSPRDACRCGVSEYRSTPTRSVRLFVRVSVWGADPLVDRILGRRPARRRPTPPRGRTARPGEQERRPQHLVGPLEPARRQACGRQRLRVGSARRAGAARRKDRVDRRAGRSSVHGRAYAGAVARHSGSRSAAFERSSVDWVVIASALADPV